MSKAVDRASRAAITCAAHFARSLLFLVACKSILESADPFAQSSAQLRQPPWAEDDQHDPEDEQEVHRLQQSFKHDCGSPDDGFLRRDSLSSRWWPLRRAPRPRPASGGWGIGRGAA